MSSALFTTSDMYSLIAVGVCLVISSFFSAAETAITSLGALKVRHLIDSHGKSMNHLKIWLDKPHRIITTILIYNTAINILAGAITTGLAIKYFDDRGIAIATGAVTFLVLTFGEIIPKSYAKAHAEPVAIYSLHIVRMAYYALFPLVWLFSEAAQIFVTYMTKNKSHSPSITEEELEFLINVGESDGAIEDTKRDMISGVFDFDETVVREVMTPRTDINALNEDSDTIQDAIQLINECGHSRIPVFKDSIDNVTGIVLVKDIIKYAAKANGGPAPKLSDLIREPYFTPESKPLMEVFKDLKKSKVHMAIVVDEYGGTAGIVTMEDILEEIVGDIQDEHDVEEAEIVEITPGIYDVSGAVNIDEFVEFYGLEDTVSEAEKEKLEADVDTVGGWITEIVGELPEVGQRMTIGHLIIEVTEVGQRRIERMRVTREKPASEVEAQS